MNGRIVFDDEEEKDVGDEKKGDQCLLRGYIPPVKDATSSLRDSTECWLAFDPWRDGGCHGVPPTNVDAPVSGKIVPSINVPVITYTADERELYSSGWVRLLPDFQEPRSGASNIRN